LVYELRAFGVGVVLVCPDSELLPAPVLKDVGAIVAMSPDSLPRFALERYLFRASLEEAEDVLKRLKTAKAIVYYRGRLHFLRRLPRPPKTLKLKAGPKGDRMGVTDSGAGSLRAWPILHRSPGRPAPKVVEVEPTKEEVGEPKIIEVVEVTEAEKPKPKVAEVVEELRLEPEEEEVEQPEVMPTEKGFEEKPIEPGPVEEEKAEMVKEEMPLEESGEPEPAPKGPPIPSSPLQGIALPSRAPPPYTRPLIYVIGCPAGWMNSP
jgi:hypothetical protein